MNKVEFGEKIMKETYNVKKKYKYNELDTGAYEIRIGKSTLYVTDVAVYGIASMIFGVYSEEYNLEDLIKAFDLKRI